MSTRALLPLTLLTLAPAAHALKFDRACEPASQTVIIGAVGDFLMHKPLQDNGNANGYASLWKGVQYRINQVDIMYGNLETPTARGITNGLRKKKDPGSRFDGEVYSSFPMFNAPPDLVTAIERSGFDVVSTANNHSWDRGADGIDATIEELQAAGLPLSGTRRSGSTGSYSTIVNAGGISVAFVACTYSLNGFKDKRDQVLECYSERGELLREVREMSRRADAVIVTPHWGEEYQHNPRDREKKLARDLIDAGAVAVIGTHPHVIQPNEVYTTSSGRQGFIGYSTGNFIAGQAGIKRVGLMNFIGLSKNGGDVWVNGARYAPTYMTSMKGGAYFLDNTGAYREYKSKVAKVMKDEHGFLGKDERLVTNPECN